MAKEAHKTSTKSSSTSSKSPSSVEPKHQSTGADDGKICAILSYLLIGIIWYFVDENMKKNDFVKFHVKQGLVLLIVAVLAHVVMSILWFLWFIWWVVQLVILILAIIGIIAAVNGQKKELPVIGQFAKHFNF